ncbi:MAG: MoaD/ThiS family protein [Desulfobacteraceae bacterium]|nr:MAG: MoaD/ThiS family protein [Desulfobacteraceae bacterium]
MMEEKSVEIKLVGFPTLYDFLKSDRIQHVFSGHTLKDLIEDLFHKYGEKIRDTFWDQRIDRLDPTIQVIINGKFVEASNPQSVEIFKDDHVSFLRLLAGG